MINFISITLHLCHCRIFHVAIQRDAFVIESAANKNKNHDYVIRKIDIYIET